jgi:hypothetical protein
MAVAGLIFFISGLAFLALIAAALFATFGLFLLPWPILIFAIWSWAALCVAGYHVVRAIELVNAPDWRALGWIGIRSALVTLTCPGFWLTASGGIV